MGSGGQRPNARRDRAVRVEGERARRVRVGPARSSGGGAGEKACWAGRGLEALREWAGAENGLGPCGRRMGWAVGVLGPGLVSLLGLDSFSNFFSYF